MWNLALHLHCNPSDVFVELQRTLDKDLIQIETLTDEDFYWLMWNENRNLLGILLRCPPGETLQRLFDSDQLLQMLVKAGIVTEKENMNWRGDSEWLLGVFLSKEAYHRLAEFSGTSDRWSLLRDLLRDQARQELARSLNCSPADPLPHLIAYVKNSTQSASKPKRAGAFGKGEVLDFIGISKLRTLVHVMQFALLELSKSLADTASGRLASYNTPRNLPGLINFYIGRRFKSALESTLTLDQTLRQMDFKIESVYSPGKQESPSGRNAQPYPQAGIPPQPADPEFNKNPVMAAINARDDGAGFVDVTIQYRSTKSWESVEIIHIRDVNQADAEHIQNYLPKTIGDLSSIGINLRERLLNTRIPEFSVWKRRLREAIGKANNLDEIDEAFVQCFVLSGASLKPHLTAPNLIVEPNLETGFDPSVCVEFPLALSQIAANLEAEYASQGRRLNKIPAQPPR